MIVFVAIIVALSALVGVLLAYRIGQQDGRAAERRRNRKAAARIWDRLQEGK